MSRNSSLRFKDFSLEFGSFIRVVWNGVEIYNDDTATSNTLKLIEKKYGEKIVYSMFVQVVQFHHCELYIEGEE